MTDALEPSLWAINEVEWQSRQDDLSWLRDIVFVHEQGVPKEEELDDKDALESTRHFLLIDGDQPVGCARLLASGQIGRIAILSEYRRKGLGAWLLKEVIHVALQEGKTPFLHAQVNAMSFYEKQGFEARGESFLDAGIEHKAMHLKAGAEQLQQVYGDEVQRLQQADDFIVHLAQISRNASRCIDIFSDQLDPLIWANKAVEDGISALARKSRFSRIRILLGDSRPLQGSKHPLIDLAQRLSSKIEIRKISGDASPPRFSCLIADQRQLVLFNDESKYIGFANYNAPAESRHQLDEFNRVWDYSSEKDPNLSQLHI